MHGKYIGFALGVGLGCMLFTYPSYMSFGESWWVALIPICVIIGGIFAWILGGMSE